MQSQFEEHFKTLTDHEAEYLADAICGYRGMCIIEDVPVSGEALFGRLVNHNVCHKDAVMSLANDPSGLAVICLEKLVGKPIREYSPPAVSEKVKKLQKAAPKRVSVSKMDPRTIHNIVPGAKRPGSKSFERYQLYKEGMTISDFIKAGGTMGDIKHDASKGFITLKEPE